MKGVVFTEFLELVEQRWGLDVLDDVLERAAVPCEGAYTTVGIYPPEEMGQLVGALCAETGSTGKEVLRVFGGHLLRTFSRNHGGLFQQPGPLEFLEEVDNYIHVEVRKLYPDAQLPRFTVVERTQTTLTLRYQSPRCLSALAEGLIAETLVYFETPGAVEVVPLDALGSDVNLRVVLTP